MKRSINLIFILLSLHLSLGAQTMQWAKRVSTTIPLITAKDIVVDHNHNVIATGVYVDSTIIEGIQLPDFSHFNFYIAKYNSSGTIIWVKGIGGSGWDDSYSMAIDQNDNIIVTGFFKNDTLDFGSGNFLYPQLYGDNIFVAKFNSAGVFQWAQCAYSDPVSSMMRSNFVTTDLANNIYIAGMYEGNGHFGSVSTSYAFSNIFIAKYDANGNINWVRNGECSLGMGWQDNFINGLVIDSNQQIYATGKVSDKVTFNGITYLTSQHDGQIITFKMDAAGNIDWIQSAGNAKNTAGYSEYGKAIQLDHSGHVIVGGSRTDSSGINYNYQSLTILKYDLNGNLVWEKKHGSSSSNPSAEFNVINELKLDAQDNIYITGNYFDTINLFGAMLPASTDLDIFIAKLDSSANHIWSIHGVSNSNDGGQALDLDASNGNIAVCGYYQDTITLNNVTIADPFPLFSSPGQDAYIGLINPALPSTIISFESIDDFITYPNPTTGLLNISSINHAEYDKISITDITGRMLFYSNETLPVLDMTDYKNGIYFITLSSKNQHTSRKIIKQ